MGEIDIRQEADRRPQSGKGREECGKRRALSRAKEKAKSTKYW